MQIHISYDLLGNGWSICLIRVNQTIHQIRITHVFSSPIEDCLLVLNKIIKGEKNSAFTWYDEPGGTRIQMEETPKDATKIQISAEQFDTSFGEEIRNETKYSNLL